MVLTIPISIPAKTNLTSTSFLGESYNRAVLTTPPSSPIQSATCCGVDPSEMVSKAYLSLLPVRARILDIVSGSEWDRTMSAPRDLTREKLRGEEVEMTRRPLRWASWTAAWPTEEEPPQMRTSVCGWGFGVEVEVEKDGIGRGKA